ncbi:MAG: CDGSH iron-sulfur domain-containing protein [Acidobacteriota bacterium]
MPDPKIAQKAPFVQETEPGDHWWCACGLSAKQPFCDGSHKGTGHSPIRFTLEAQKRVAWCGCKHSKNKPVCDGSHRDL